VRSCPKCGTRYSDDLAYCPSDGSATTLVAPHGADVDPLVGTTIDGRYRLEARIGEGGMGVVYRASHTVLKKALAIKVMRGEQAQDPEVVQRFVQEAQSASAIGHPNIIGISDFGTTTDGSVYFAMEYLQGQSLGKAMEHGPLARERAVHIFVQMASALDAAHQRGIVHRDLKPDNVFLIRQDGRDDFVKVLDFGIAKVKNAAAKITRTGMVFGTPHYMSPEQAAGQAVDHRSDIYSFGVILYLVFAGQLPFDAESYMGVMTKHMYDDPVPPSRIVPQLRGAAEAVIMKALEKKPERRYQSMLDLKDDLERLGRGEPVLAADRGFAVSDTLAFTTPPLGSAPAGTGTAPAAAPSPTMPEIRSSELGFELPRHKRPAWLLPAVITSCLGLIVAYLLARSSASAPAAASAPQASTAPPGVPAPAVQPASALAPQPSAASPALGRIHLSAQPPGSELYADGALIGQSEASVERPRQGQTRIEVRHPGFVAQAVLLDAHSPDSIQVSLEEEPHKAHRAVPSASATKPEPPRPQGAPKAQPHKPNPLNDVVDPWQ
jgi:serine/threonine-protein kinase